MRWPIFPGSVHVSMLQPVAASEVVKALADRGATVYSLDLLPRISRAQSMDALSSQATVTGYRAGLSPPSIWPSSSRCS